MERKIRPVQLLVALLIIDLFFLALHIVLRLATDPYDNTLSDFQGPAYLRSLLHNDNLYVNTDRGYAEIFQYLKELLIVVVLVHFAYSKKVVHFLFLGLLFLIILLDDMLMLHEHLGWRFVDWLGITSLGSIQRQDIAQILSMAVLEGWVVLLIAVTFFGLPVYLKRSVFWLYVLIFFLVFFGVFTDFLHGMINARMRGADLIEDGGEMLIMSFIVYYVYKRYFVESWRLDP